jgi:ubiquinone/menaquinone biosynthesis C-methylase UbiE
MERLSELFNKRKNLKILDVGTGSGNFINLIKSLYSDYEEIVGIDSIEIAISTASKNFIEDDKVSFKLMNALEMTFPDGYFDVVCLSNSLHHLSDIKKSISEMERVLAKGGFILISEMINNDLDEKQISHLKLHHFAAEVDRLLGDVHNDTYSDKKIVKILEENSSLEIVDSWKLDYVRREDNTEEEIKWLMSTLDRIVKRVIDPMKKKDIKKKARDIKKYIKIYGFDSCTTMIVVIGK